MCDINSLVGIDFKNGGRTKDGCDCMGLAILAHKMFKKIIPDFQIDCSDSTKINSAFEGQLLNTKWHKIEKPESPCLVLFGLNPNIHSMVTHVGTYIGNDKVLHTLEKSSSHIISIYHPFYKSKILGYYKYE